MVDVLGRATAVLAPMVVPEEDRTTGEGQGPRIGHGHVPPQADHGWDMERRRLRMPGNAEFGNRICGTAKDEHDSPPGRHHRQRFVAGVEDECSRHGRKRSNDASFVSQPTERLAVDD